MNPTAQRNHKTAVATLEKATEKALAVIAARLDEQSEVQSVLRLRLDTLSKAISDERTHRLELANQQRAYVDNENRLLRQSITELRQRGFWSRLNWLLTGR